MTTEAAAFVRTHIAPALTSDEERKVAKRIKVPAVPSPLCMRYSSIIPTLDPEELVGLNTAMFVQCLCIGEGTRDKHDVRLSVENTLLKYQLYDSRTGRPARLPMEHLCRSLSAIGYRRYANQFSKLAIRISDPFRGTVSLHRSGKLLVTGTINVDVARHLARFFIPKKLFPMLGFAHFEARDEVLSNIVVKMETPYTFSPFMMAAQEEDVSYQPTIFSSAMLKNEGEAPVAHDWPQHAPAERNSTADILSRRFGEPDLPRRTWAMLFFKPNRALFVGLTQMQDIEPMARIADAIAYPYHYEDPENRAEEDRLEANYTRRRTRKRPRPPQI